MSSDTCCGWAAWHETPTASVPAAGGILTAADRLARIRFRLGIGRMRLTVPPGLYALNDPTDENPVLITANFRLSFDALRSSMGERAAWILVLDTKGVNVWCAAGKGTFGTEELVRRIVTSGLAEKVSHRRLILPQLGAPGVAAHAVESATGFRVVYGPVEARDLPGFLDAGMQASPAMRRREFPLRERLELIPLELVQSWKLWLPLAAVSGLLTLILDGAAALSPLLDSAPALLGAAAGAVLTPLLLPLIPGRAFALKGGLVGAIAAAAFLAAVPLPLGRAALILALTTASASFLALNFTGATTFTSPAGVKKEMRIAIPLQGGLLLAGIAARIAGGILWPI